MRLIISREAIRDLDGVSLWTYENFGPRQAKSYMAKIEEGCGRLADGHSQGRPADELAPGIRKLRIESHIVYFRLKDEDLLILRVLHSRMDVRRHF